MGFSGKALVFFLVAVMAGASPMDATYIVGGAAGWSIMGDFNYNEWASSNTFYAGDTLHKFLFSVLLSFIICFIYMPDLHNVLQVTSSDHVSCTATAPLATYLTGDDFIPILGDDDHYYFIYGEPCHCEFGQKVDIQVASQVPDVLPPSPLTSTPTL
ncbi:hypothetical protein MKX03_035802 [Papaver bracteatum]|nr:hypothetical protein MKX03_035802 [Papaver bracteatum]